MDFTDGVMDILIPGLPEDVLLCCDMCGEKHLSRECKLVLEAPRIRDGMASRARVTLPSVLALRSHLDTSATVVCTVELRAGTLFGPMVAPLTDHITNHQFPVKVFGRDGEPDQYLDAGDENQCNWMCLVPPSSEAQLHNLSCIQVGGDIYYVVRRTVPAGASLHVWYAPYYAAKLRHTLTADLLAPPPPADVTEVVLIREPEPPARDDEAEERYEEEEEEGGRPQSAPRLPCPYCDRRSAGPAALASHLLGVHPAVLADLPSQPPPVCAVCGATCTDGRTLVAHLRTHRAKHRCRHCDKVFSRRQTLRAHPCPGPRRAAEGWPCPHCGRMFTTAAAWRRHQRRHTGALRCTGCGRHFASAATRAAHVCRAAAPADRPLTCLQCARRFANAASLRQHAALHSDRFACARCSRRFSGAAPLRRHEALCGAGEQLARHGSVACRRCEARLDSLAALAEHARAHELPHRCSTCGHRFRARLQLSAHVCSRLAPERAALPDARPADSAAAPAPAAAALPSRVVCETCAQTFSSKKALWLHRFTHAERQFACELCDRKFKRKDTMMAHLLAHGQAQVPCPHCDKRFKSKKSLAVHVRLHTGDARFACDTCDRRFVQKANMEKHRRTHDPDHKLAHRCDTCGKCLSSRHHLQEHQLEHTQGRTQRCAACPRAFVKRRDLQRHLSLVHGTSQYECPFCHMTTKLKSSISRHLNKMHPAERDQWSTDGFIENLRSDPGRPADSILTLEPSSTLLLAVPSTDDALDSSLARSPSAAVLGDTAAGDQDVLLYVIDVPEMDITFDPPQ